ncbi:MAG TPA: hypothetical protein P5140_05755 [Methanofastidiosum sp.]|nr:hypothetical protein [Methanofastidiosum sp.]
MDKENLLRNTLDSLDDDLSVTGFSTNILQLKEGVNRIRLVMTKGYVKYRAHFIPPEVRGEDDTSVGGMVVCLKEFGCNCPICEYVTLLFQSTSELNQMRAKKLYARNRFRFLVIDREEKREGVSPMKILSCGSVIAEGIKECNKNYGDPADPERGYDLQIELKKVEGWNKYKISPVMKLVMKDGKRTFEIVETPLTEAEKNYSFPSLEKTLSYDVDVLEEDLLKLFGPKIQEITEVLSKEKTMIKEVSELDSELDVDLETGENGEKDVNLFIDKQKQEVQVSGVKSETHPKCFGMYDPEDAENCLRCTFQKECKVERGL